jgi:hypothetical protein
MVTSTTTTKWISGLYAQAQYGQVTGALLEYALEISNIGANGKYSSATRSRRTRPWHLPTSSLADHSFGARTLPQMPRRYFAEESICFPKLSSVALFCE